MHVRDENKSKEHKHNRHCTFSFIKLTSESKTKSIIAKNRNLLIFLLRGEIFFMTDSLGKHVLREMDFLFIQSLLPVKLCIKPETRLVMLSIGHSVITEGLNVPVDHSPESRENQFFIRQINNPLLLFLNQLAIYFQDGVGDEDTLYELKLRELAFILKEYYAEDIDFSCFSTHTSSEGDFKEKVMMSFMKAKTVVELAELCGYGLKSFQRMFNLHFGETPYQWMRKQMASHIEARLLDSAVPIKQIVAEFGFSSVSHFNTFCKKYFGATPKKVRNNSYKKKA